MQREPEAIGQQRPQHFSQLFSRDRFGIVGDRFDLVSTWSTRSRAGPTGHTGDEFARNPIRKRNQRRDPHTMPDTASLRHDHRIGRGVRVRRRTVGKWRAPQSIASAARQTHGRPTRHGLDRCDVESERDSRSGINRRLLQQSEMFLRMTTPRNLFADEMRFHQGICRDLLARPQTTGRSPSVPRRGPRPESRPLANPPLLRSPETPCPQPTQ